eukprot:1768130-Amphidinium_carterae.1
MAPSPEGAQTGQGPVRKAEQRQLQQPPTQLHCAQPVLGKSRGYVHVPPSLGPQKAHAAVPVTFEAGIGEADWAPAPTA